MHPEASTLKLLPIVNGIFILYEFKVVDFSLSRNKEFDQCNFYKNTEKLFMLTLINHWKLINN